MTPEVIALSLLQKFLGILLYQMDVPSLINLIVNLFDVFFFELTNSAASINIFVTNYSSRKMIQVFLFNQRDFLSTERLDSGLVPINFNKSYSFNPFQDLGGETPQKQRTFTSEISILTLNIKKNIIFAVKQRIMETKIVLNLTLNQIMEKNISSIHQIIENITNSVH